MLLKVYFIEENYIYLTINISLKCVRRKQCLFLCFFFSISYLSKLNLKNSNRSRSNKIDITIAIYISRNNYVVWTHRCVINNISQVSYVHRVAVNRLTFSLSCILYFFMRSLLSL